jgi:hypothetical protein
MPSSITSEVYHLQSHKSPGIWRETTSTRPSLPNCTQNSRKESIQRETTTKNTLIALPPPAKLSNVLPAQLQFFKHYLTLTPRAFQTTCSQHLYKMASGCMILVASGSKFNTSTARRWLTRNSYLEALETLRSQSLLYQTGNELNVPRLVQTVTCAEMTYLQRQRSCNSALDLLEASFPKEIDGKPMWHDWKLCKKYLRHVLSFCKKVPEEFLHIKPRKLAELLSACTW